MLDRPTFVCHARFFLFPAELSVPHIPVLPAPPVPVWTNITYNITFPSSHFKLNL